MSYGSERGKEVFGNQIGQIVWSRFAELLWRL
jgi:hypothetical protein